MPQIGESMIENYIKMEHAGIDMLKEILAVQTGNEDFRKLEIDVNCEKPALHANLSYLDEKTLMTFANAIANNIFVVRVSKESDLYTSDFPVVVSPHVQNARPMYMGLAQYGGELTMPLSPSLTVSIYDNNYFKDKKDMDGSFIEADAKEIRRQNLLRYMYATRHVFSFKNDFSLIDSYFKLYGEHHFLKPNHKAEVISGLKRY